MRNLALRSALVATIVVVAACSSDDDADTTDTTPSSDTTVTTAGSGPTDKTLEEIEAIVVTGLLEDYGQAEVSCPVELTQSATTLDCDFSLEDGTQGFATVTANAGAVTLDHAVVIGSTVPTTEP